ncbi:MAG: hypothetical protein HY063_15145 [Bacteroidetes bacterium]|nr:hypothetical protein [Bacteroidota bacterium]
MADVKCSEGIETKQMADGWKKILFFFLIFSLSHFLTCFSQENIFTAGFQYKPIFPSAFFSTATNSVSQNGIDFSISQKFGYCAGMVLRRGITKRFSFETGINYVKRNYSLSITDTTFTGNSDFAIIGYEIPLQGLIFIQLGKKLYMNSSAGISWDMYPSNVKTADSYFNHYAARHFLFQSSVLANVGYEFRTVKSGYFYIGGSYHLPFSYFYLSAIEYTPQKEITHMKLRGNYLTLDFRYFFHEDPLKPKKKKKS